MNLFKRRSPAKIDRPVLEAGVKANSQFALELYQQLGISDGNLFFSPFSISTALAMTCEGAAGATRSQMVAALHFLPDAEQNRSAFAQLHALLSQIQKRATVTLNSANALWVDGQASLERPFIAQIKESYGGKLSEVDFGNPEAARQQINHWVEKNTAGKISDLIGAGVLDTLTRLVLTNAIYFFGNWQNQFDPERSEDARFTTSSGETVPARMMNQKHTFRYGENDDMQILELPYAGADLALWVLLPRQIDGLPHLETLLNYETLTEWSANLAETQVQVALPRFEINCPIRLDETLRTMGMEDAFSERADFSALSREWQLYIGAILHKAYVRVNEAGTEAAAATAVVMQTKSLPVMSVSFRADHPFLFLIREQSSGSLLFLGRVINPAIN